MSRALKATSRKHEAMVRLLGVLMSPLHCRAPAKTRDSAHMGIDSENQRK